MQQTSGGLFEYLNTNAKACNVSVKAIIPAEAMNSGRAKDVLFTINVSAGFHDAAKFINNIESGVIPIVITQSQFRSEPMGNSLLDVLIEGQAHLPAEMQ
jgi:hypothetical protein